MEFFNYRSIRSKLKKSGILFKKLSLEDASSQFYSLARQLEDHKLYVGYCHLAISNCHDKRARVGALLNAARAFSNASYEVICPEDHVRATTWVYNQTLLICDRSFIKPICLEMGKFHEIHHKHQKAAECFKQSMSIGQCVTNLILANRYRCALDELKNCPSHLMTTKEHTTMFLLGLLLNEDSTELKRNSLQHLSAYSRTPGNRGSLPVDDNLSDLDGLLESLMISRKELGDSKSHRGKNLKILKSIVDKLSAFLDPSQIHLLFMIIKPQIHLDTMKQWYLELLFFHHSIRTYWRNQRDSFSQSSAL